MKQEIRIGFSTQNKWYMISSWLIRKLTGSKASHVWISFRDETLGKVVVMHATRWGYRIEPWIRFKRHSNIVSMFTSKEDLLPGIHFVADFLGTRYDFGNLIGFMWVIFMEWFKIKIKNPFRDSAHIVCSEAVLMIIKASMKNPQLLKMDRETTSPQDLLDFCATNSNFIKVVENAD